MNPLARHWRHVVHIACLAALAALVAGCVYVPAGPGYGYAPAYGYAPGYGYSPYAYPAPVFGGVTLGFGGGGGWYGHRRR